MQNAFMNAAVATTFLSLSAVVPAAAADPMGNWLTKDGGAKVAIARCTGPGATPGTLCGTIVSLKQPNDPATGRPKTDTHNPDAAKRNRPVVGVQIVFDLKQSGTPDKWDGQVYNPEEGKTYSGSIAMTGANALDLKGCALGGLICKSQTWTRTN